MRWACPQNVTSVISKYWKHPQEAWPSSSSPTPSRPVVAASAAPNPSPRSPAPAAPAPVQAARAPRGAAIAGAADVPPPPPPPQSQPHSSAVAAGEDGGSWGNGFEVAAGEDGGSSGDGLEGGFVEEGLAASTPLVRRGQRDAEEQAWAEDASATVEAFLAETIALATPRRATPRAPATPLSPSELPALDALAEERAAEEAESRRREEAGARAVAEAKAKAAAEEAAEAEAKVAEAEAEAKAAEAEAEAKAAKAQAEAKAAAEAAAEAAKAEAEARVAKAEAEARAAKEAAAEAAEAEARRREESAQELQATVKEQVASLLEGLEERERQREERLARVQEESALVQARLVEAIGKIAAPRAAEDPGLLAKLNGLQNELDRKFGLMMQSMAAQSAAAAPSPEPRRSQTPQPVGGPAPAVDGKQHKETGRGGLARTNAGSAKSSETAQPSAVRQMRGENSRKEEQESSINTTLRGRERGAKEQGMLSRGKEKEKEKEQDGDENVGTGKEPPILRQGEAEQGDSEEQREGRRGKPSRDQALKALKLEAREARREARARRREARERERELASDRRLSASLIAAVPYQASYLSNAPASFFSPAPLMPAGAPMLPTGRDMPPPWAGAPVPWATQGGWGRAAAPPPGLPGDGFSGSGGGWDGGWGSESLSAGATPGGWGGSWEARAARMKWEADGAQARVAAAEQALEREEEAAARKRAEADDVEKAVAQLESIWEARRGGGGPRGDAGRWGRAADQLPLDELLAAEVPLPGGSGGGRPPLPRRAGSRGGAGELAWRGREDWRGEGSGFGAPRAGAAEGHGARWTDPPRASLAPEDDGAPLGGHWARESRLAGRGSDTIRAAGLGGVGGAARTRRRFPLVESAAREGGTSSLGGGAWGAVGVASGRELPVGAGAAAIGRRVRRTAR